MARCPAQTESDRGACRSAGPQGLFAHHLPAVLLATGGHAVQGHQAEQSSLSISSGKALPEWLPDELFFSWASRYHLLSGSGQARNTCLALFGHGRWGYQHDFPCPLNSFVAVTQGGFGNADLIARQRTILPFYLAHRDELTARAANAAMAEPAGGMLKYQLGMLTSRFRANHPLKACPQCMRYDSSLYGSDLPGFFAPVIPGKMAPILRGAREKESIHRRANGCGAA
jgi:hypothetical protein